MEKQIKLSSTSDVAKTDGIELQEVMENAARSMENLIVQFETASHFEEMLPMCELLGRDKQLRSIRGSLKVEVAKKVELQQHIEREKRKHEEICNIPDCTDMQREEIQRPITNLNDGLKTRQESIDILKSRLTNQITSFKDTIAKVLDKDTSLAEKIRMLLREQGITIASVLRAIEMAIGLLVEALLPGGSGTDGTAGKPPPMMKKV